MTRTRRCLADSLRLLPLTYGCALHASAIYSYEWPSRSTCYVAEAAMNGPLNLGDRRCERAQNSRGRPPG